MLPILIECVECDETRVGRFSPDGGVTTARDTCPSCGSREWAVDSRLEHLTDDG